METVAALQANNMVSQVFDIGAMQVAVFPAGDGRLAHFLLYRTHPASHARVLIGSGSTDDTASCIRQAMIAARRAGELQ